MNSLCLIITGGEYAEIPEDIRKADYVIACDRGWQYAQQMGIKPDLIIGDFDSSPRPETDIPILQFPSHKDDTDTMLAAREALKRGFKNIAICCAFGARLDHTMANIQSMAYAASHGCKCELYAGDEYFCTLTKSSGTFPAKENFSFSVFSLTDSCAGVSITGAEYECSDVTLTNAFPLGVSNKWKKDAITVSLAEGILLIVESRYR